MDSSAPDKVERDVLTCDTGEGDLETADAWTILRYEEHITKLLVTITELNNKIEHLEQRAAREDDEYTDQCSQYTSSLPREVWKPPYNSVFEHVSFPDAYALEDKSSDLFLELQKVVASLEYVVYSKRNHATSSYGTATSDGTLSLAGEEWIPIAKALEEIEQGLGITPVEESQYEEEISHFREKNMALRVAIGDKELELDRSEVTLRAFQEERDKLQKKIQELQNCLQKMEASLSPPRRHSESFNTGGSSSSALEEYPWTLQGVFRDPIILAQNLVCCLQTIPGAQCLCQLLSLQHQPVASHSSIKVLETETQQLKGYLDKLLILNDLLAVTLEECKSDSERLSMHLAKQESKSTALHLALKCSERCMEAYAMLLMQADWKQKLLLEQVLGKDNGYPGGAQKWQTAPWGLDGTEKLVLLEAKKAMDRVDPEEGGTTDSEAGSSCSWSPVVLSNEDEELLKEYIQKLKEDRASVTVTLVPLSADEACHSPEVAHLTDVIRAKVDDATEAALDILPGMTEKPKLDRTLLQKDLLATREDMSEMKTRLHLAEKEKRVLELQMLMHGIQEGAYLLLIQHLQWELEEWIGKPTLNVSSESSTEDSSSNSSSMTHASEEERAGAKIKGDPSVMHELIQSLARSSELRGRIQALLTAMEKSVKNSNFQKLQSIQITSDFFRARRINLLNYLQLKSTVFTLNFRL
ncbi:Usher syndrome type-1C protein-binding protein 1 isoform X2 [Rhinatrema bivittatum]|uniref:Usher syndrome type-1C protein-binding protein 1 isoform X2 n=1 Tax=Rhinatrema bivittatum TaxID=194408 RepID=UPI00112ECC9B|nr:Usher syndrome type-1C protein-binding protein 1 isoform X2 [Rhinatrema bivittatum]